MPRGPRLHFSQGGAAGTLRFRSMAMRYLVVALSLLLASGCAGVRLEAVRIRGLTPEQASAFVRSSPVKVLDLRPAAEYERAHLPCALSYPAERLSSFQGDKAGFILVYDARGERSFEAALLLLDEGYDRVFELKGGLEAWTAAGLPLSPETPARSYL